MSCLVYSHEDSVTNWLHRNGIFNRFIHNNVNTLIGFLESSSIEYNLELTDCVQLTTGIPLMTTFSISADRIVSNTLGTLNVIVDSWDATLDKASSKELLKTAVFGAATKQGTV